MKVLNIEEIEPTKRKMILQIDPDDLTAEREEAYGELGKEVAIPGFRKGHVPRKFLEYRFDKELTKEAFADAVQKSLQEAVKENDLQVIGLPEFEDEDFEKKIETVKKDPIEVAFTLEVVPKFDLLDLSGVELEVEDFVVTEQMIDSVIDQERHKAADYRAVDDRPTRKGDFIEVKLDATRDDEKFTPLIDESFLLNDLAGEGTTDEFDGGFLERETGEPFEFEFVPPQDHVFFHSESNSPILLNGEIKVISEEILPDADDEFAKDCGSDSLESFREKIRETLEGQHDIFVNRRKRGALEEYLLKNTSLDVPESLLAAHFQSLKRRRLIQSYMDGFDETLLPEEEKIKRDLQTRSHAADVAKLRLIFQKMAKEEGLEVSDDEYYEIMSQRAIAQGVQDVDRHLADIDRAGDEDAHKEEILLDKALTALMEKCEFKVIPPKAQM